MFEDNTLYITGTGVSAESGIPTFRGTDGLWTVGSQNYTPQEMALDDASFKGRAAWTAFRTAF